MTVNVRYREYFEHLNGEHDIVKSGVVTIQATDLKDNQAYNLALVNAPKDFDSAKKYADQPTVALYDQNKKLVVQQTGANNEAQPWFTGSNLLSRTLDLTQKIKITQLISLRLFMLVILLKLSLQCLLQLQQLRQQVLLKQLISNWLIYGKKRLNQSVKNLWLGWLVKRINKYSI